MTMLFCFSWCAHLKRTCWLKVCFLIKVSYYYIYISSKGSCECVAAHLHGSHEPSILDNATRTKITVLAEIVISFLVVISFLDVISFMVQQCYFAFHYARTNTLTLQVLCGKCWIIDASVRFIVSACFIWHKTNRKITITGATNYEILSTCFQKPTHWFTSSKDSEQPMH